MDEQSTSQNDSEKSAVQLLQEINAGLIDPKVLDSATRQRCIELLVAEGYAATSMAEILKRNERTVRRDLKEIQARNALSPDLSFAKEFVGQAFQKAMNHHDSLTRMARAKEGSLSDKSQAEFLAWRVLKEFIDTLQRLGYLPCKSAELVVSHQDLEPSLEEIEKTVAEIQTIAQETDTDDVQFKEAFEQIQKGLEKSRLAHDAAALLNHQKQIQGAKENNHE